MAEWERVGTWVVVVITAVTLATVGVSELFSLAADDLYAVAAQARNGYSDYPRTAYGSWLSARLAPDVSGADAATVQDRANQLASRGDRLREATGVQGLIGLLVAILTARPAVIRDSRRDAIQPAANTASNGTA